MLRISYSSLFASDTILCQVSDLLNSVQSIKFRVRYFLHVYFSIYEYENYIQSISILQFCISLKIELTINKRRITLLRLFFGACLLIYMYYSIKSCYSFLRAVTITKRQI